MKLDNKFFSALSAAFAVQMIWGINLANAMQCEREIEQQWNNSHTYGDGGKEYYGIFAALVNALIFNIGGCVT